jgi:hypothetical protein
VSSASLGCGKSSQLLAPGRVTASRLMRPRQRRFRFMIQAAVSIAGVALFLSWPSSGVDARAGSDHEAEVSGYTLARSGGGS